MKMEQLLLAPSKEQERCLKCYGFKPVGTACSTCK